MNTAKLNEMYASSYALEIMLRRYGRRVVVGLAKMGITAHDFSSYLRTYDNGSTGYESLVHIAINGRGHVVTETEMLEMVA